MLFFPKQKKAQIEIQFNWIFVLIIGAVVLGFFLTIINNQQKRSTAEEATDLVETLDTVFNTISTNPNTIDSFPITNANVIFECEYNNGFTSRYTIQGAGPIDTQYEAIFTPATLKGDNIITWTQVWQSPFEVAVLTYMANDRTIFLFVTDNTDTIIRKLYQELPLNFAKQLLDQSGMATYTTKGYDRYVIITDHQNLLLPNPLKPKAHQRVLPTPDADFGESITMTFKHYQGNSEISEKDVPVLTKALFWGAVFSEDKAFYECNLRKVVTRLLFVTTITAERAAGIRDDLYDHRCYTHYFDAAQTLQGMAALPLGTNPNTLRTISDKLQAVDAIEKRIRRASCPYLY